jgi:hypothetical protein
MHPPRFWDRGNLTSTTPEGSASYFNVIDGEQRFAAVMLVDPKCHVQQAREWFVPGYGVHDRPQRIADLRADLARNGHRSPFLVLSERPAKSVNTNRMLSAYCLDAWWFVDGRRLRVGKPPITAFHSPDSQTSLRVTV